MTQFVIFEYFLTLNRDAFTKLLTGGELTAKAQVQCTLQEDVQFPIAIAKLCFFAHLNGKFYGETLPMDD